MGSTTSEDPVQQLRDSIVTMGLLTQQQADVYALALREGTVSSSRVSQVYSAIRPNTAVGLLKRMAANGFLDAAPRIGKELKTGRGNPIIYRAKPVSLAFGDRLAAFRNLEQLADRVQEQTEVKAEEAGPVGDIWISNSQRTLFPDGLRVLAAARSQIDIMGRDCSFLGIKDVTASLLEALKHGVRVRIASGIPPDKTIQKPLHVRVISRAKQIGMLPFCIVDQVQLMIAFKKGPLGNEYSLIMSSNKDLAEGFSAIFDAIWSSPIVGRRRT